MTSKPSTGNPLVDEVQISEACLIGILYNKPELFDMYSDEKLNSKIFGNKIFEFYFQLGYYMFKQNMVNFDAINVYNAVQQLSDAIGPEFEDKYNKFGGYQTISDLVEAVAGKEDDFDSYYDTVKKYQLLRHLKKMGLPVDQKDGKYDYHKLNIYQLQKYWTDKMDNAFSIIDGKWEEYDLLGGLQESIDKWDKHPDIGLPLDGSRLTTERTSGWAKGHIYLWGQFSGKGKTSWVMRKLVMSAIRYKEKMCILANEEDIDRYQKALLITIIGNQLYT